MASSTAAQPEPKSEQEVLSIYRTMQSEMQGLIQNLTKIEMERNEHRWVDYCNCMILYSINLFRMLCIVSICLGCRHWGDGWICTIPFFFNIKISRSAVFCVYLVFWLLFTYSYARLVEETLEPLDPDRRAFRLVGGVLVSLVSFVPICYVFL